MRAFLHAGPTAWNSMPEHIRAEPDNSCFYETAEDTSFNLASNVH